MLLHHLFDAAATRHVDRVAIREKTGAHITYGQLDRLSRRFGNQLNALGVRPGDRVGICLPKSIDSVAAIFGILRAGAAYVPVDVQAPAARNAYVLANCRVRAVVVERALVEPLSAELGAMECSPHLIIVDSADGGRGLEASTPDDASAAERREFDQADRSLAYILYTSGSTGRPKGVTITHENAVSFVRWCHELIAPTIDDRFSSHAPFHFDLSILDIYTPLSAGATLVLVDELTGKNPALLAEYIARSGITVWYSAPSVLTLLLQFGKLALHDHTRLRMVLFAGEVFPVTHLRDLREIWSAPRYFNLYGPTETNVCTFHEIPAIVPADRTTPYPIGKVCSHLRAYVVDADLNEVTRGAEGELCIAGPSVTSGYWELPEQTASAYLERRDERWYRTGDLVYEDENGDYVFVGRRDRMVKRRGNRIELGEIESCLYQYNGVIEAAVVATKDESDDVQIIAHLAFDAAQSSSLIALKRFCATRLPVYMIPDRFAFHAMLPKTSTDKIDYRALSSP